MMHVREVGASHRRAIDPAPSTRETRLRVLIVSENDPLYVIQFFDAFFDRYPRDEFDLCGITVAKAFHEPLWKTARRMWHFYGSADFVRLFVRFAGARLRGDSIEKLATAAGIRCLPTESINSPEYLRQVKALAPDVIVSVAAPEIFRAEILSAARLGCINIHSGRLPRYRGMMPTFWQMLHGERSATLTVHKMASKLDAGDVLATMEFELRDRDSLHRVISETKRAGADLMITVLRQLAEGTETAQPLDMSNAGYFRFPTPTDVKAFRGRGHRLL
jgi:methionyl-tRNA formyltransferase